MHDVNSLVYISERLRGKLETIGTYPLTVICAPMGYGKTTVVDEYLRLKKTEEQEVFRQSMLGATSEDFWEDFTFAFTNANPEFSAALLKLGLPRDNSGRRKFLRMFNQFCDSRVKPMVLVLDDFQYTGCDDAYSFLHFFARSMPPALKLILIGRAQHVSKDAVFHIYNLVQHIFSDDLVFNEKDILAYSKLCGINLAQADISRIFEISAGWPALVKMCLLEYGRSGEFFAKEEVLRMLKGVLYDALSERQKSFLAALCVCENFSAEQAEYIWGEDDAGTILRELSDDSFHIELNRHSGKYNLLPLVSLMFQDVCCKEPDEAQSTRLLRVAHWYLEIEENALARRILHRIKNFGALMEAVEKRRFLVPYGRDEMEFISYYMDCPQEIRRKYPRAILTFARQMFALGYRQAGEQVCAEFMETISGAYGFEDSYSKELLAAYEVLRCYAKYNNLSLMLAHLRKAKELLAPLGVCVDWPDIGINDNFSLLYMFHRHPGDLQKEAALYAEYVPMYSSLIGGRMDGADHIFNAEMQYVTGKLQETQITLYKAKLTVSRHNQWSIWVCAALLQIRMDLAKGNWRSIEYLIEEVRESSSLRKQPVIVPAIAMMEIFIYSKLGMPKRIPELLDKIPEEKFGLVPQAVAMFHCLQAEYFLAKGAALRILAMEDEFIESARVYPNIYAEIQLDIILAGAYEQLGRRNESKERLAAALRLAAPDGIIMPFVEMSRYVGEALADMPRREFEAELKKIAEYASEYSKCLKKILAERFSNVNYGLTNREKEIARYAATRLSNKEIADKLFISESTVKTQLAHAFSKLEINKRKDLRLFFPEAEEN